MEDVKHLEHKLTKDIGYMLKYYNIFYDITDYGINITCKGAHLIWWGFNPKLSFYKRLVSVLSNKRV